MPQQRMDIRMLKDILRLKFQGNLSYECFAQSLSISKVAVAKYLDLAGAPPARLGLDGRTRRGIAGTPPDGRWCGPHPRDGVRLRSSAHRTAPQRRHADALVGRVPPPTKGAERGRTPSSAGTTSALEKTLKRSMRQQRRVKDTQVTCATKARGVNGTALHDRRDAGPFAPSSDGSRAPRTTAEHARTW